MKKEINIYGYEDRTIAVAICEDNGYHLMLKHRPDFLGTIDQKHKDELFKWLLSKEIKKEMEAIII